MSEVRICTPRARCILQPLYEMTSKLTKAVAESPNAVQSVRGPSEHQDPRQVLQAVAILGEYALPFRDLEAKCVQASEPIDTIVDISSRLWGS